MAIISHNKAKRGFELAANQSSDNKLSKQLRSLSVQHKLQAESLEIRQQRQPLPEPEQEPLPEPSQQEISSVYDDRFNKYFDNIEGLIRDMSNPVAFASAPLDGEYSTTNDLAGSYELLDDTDKPSFIQTATNLLSNFKSYSLNFTPFAQSPQSPQFSSETRGTRDTLDNASNVIKELMDENAVLKNKVADFERRDRMHDAIKGSIIKFGSEYKVGKFSLTTRPLTHSQVHRRDMASLELSRMDRSVAASNSNSNGNTATHALLKRIRQLELELSAKERQLVKKDKEMTKRDKRRELPRRRESKLGSLKTQMAHNQFLSALGNKDIKVLQDVITSEKVSMAREVEKVAENLKSWGWGEGDDLKDVCGAASTLIHHLAAATSTAASYQSKIREQFKRIRTREEELDDVKKRRKALAGKIESAEKKLAKMNTENKNLPQQTQLLESFRQQASELDVEVLNSEAVLWDYKRATTKTALGYKFCSLVEYAEKVSIVGEMGKLLLEEIQLESSSPGQPHPVYSGSEQTAHIIEEAEKALAQVSFGPLPLTSRPPELDVSANDFAPRIDSRDVNLADTVDSALKADVEAAAAVDDLPQVAPETKPWMGYHTASASLNSVDSNGDFRTSNNPNAYSNAYDEAKSQSPPQPPPLLHMDQKPRGSFSSEKDDTPLYHHHTHSSPVPSANSLRRARGENAQYDYDSSAFFARNHAGGYNDAPVWGGTGESVGGGVGASSVTPAPILNTKPSVILVGGESERESEYVQPNAPEAENVTPPNLSSVDVGGEGERESGVDAPGYSHTHPHTHPHLHPHSYEVSQPHTAHTPQVHFAQPDSPQVDRREGAIHGIGLEEEEEGESREASPLPPAYNYGYNYNEGHTHRGDSNYNNQYNDQYEDSAPAPAPAFALSDASSHAQTHLADDIPRYQLNEAPYTLDERVDGSGIKREVERDAEVERAALPAPPAPPKEDGGMENSHSYRTFAPSEITSPLINPYDTPPGGVANAPMQMYDSPYANANAHTYTYTHSQNNSPHVTFSPPMHHGGTSPRTLTAGAFKRGNRDRVSDSPSSDSTAPLNINKRMDSMPQPPPRGDSLT
ncbi:hypothetical protein E3P81_03805 [Wallemia ichthyophaga]|nr:hypothetical protein E3P97_03814 [Wallemia ichthyophaga]TIA98019.1 hypothetical protein E3P96_03260 [Wallemia ichthyophaga]TIB28270.1 hypothetical protein E3P85_03751 [Wallemia ichthyophaga]TIB43886.1 hypothetical protein E3P82_03811 [Wallemia ichthyophaga]TIB46110.1 hypothetical protein E3P81_03805 [Wallemia ichthyophaga]